MQRVQYREGVAPSGGTLRATRNAKRPDKASGSVLIVARGRGPRKRLIVELRGEATLRELITQLRAVGVEADPGQGTSELASAFIGGLSQAVRWTARQAGPEHVSVWEVIPR
jgi:hypothetical protein